MSHSKDEFDELREVFLELLYHACSYKDEYTGDILFDSEGIEAQDSALAFAIKKNWIDERKVTR